MKFNEHLKNIRKRSGITQKAVSEYLGITLRTYQRYEEGSIEPPLSTISALSECFKMPVDCILGNGFFTNWDEIILHKGELLNYLKEHVISFPETFDAGTISDELLAHLLSALFSKITFSGSDINVFPLIPPDLFPISIRADVFRTGLPERPNCVCSQEESPLPSSDKF